MEPIKDAFHRLIRFGHAAQERALPVWKSAQLQSERGLQWLRLRPQARAALFSAGMGFVTLLLLIFSGVTAAVAALAAWFTLIRHFGQTDADRQRRISESFAKAVEQLGSDKLEVRLGGIYSLERISKESPDDYWTVMENLTAFVRERSRRNEAERPPQDFEQRISRRAYFLWLEAGRPDGRADYFWTAAAREEAFGEPAADIAAVLTVFKRRSEQSREREGANGWRLDLKGAILKQYDFSDAHLERANLFDAHLGGVRFDRAHLEGADLFGAHLKWASFWDAHLEGANLFGAHLERASFSDAHLEGADLFAAHLERAILRGAHLERAILRGAHLEEVDLFAAHLGGADLRRATGLSEAQLCKAHGDAETKLPEGLARPAHWPESAPGPN